MSSGNQNIQKSRLLLVEGEDEVAFFGAFLEHLGLEDVQPYPVGGTSKFRSELTAGVLKAPNYEVVTRIGIVRDADRDPDAALDSILGTLEETILPVPDETGIFVGEDPGVGILILPGQQRKGMLETLCLDSVNDHEILGCVDEYFDCLHEHRDEIPSNVAKARMRTFLQSRNWYETQLYAEIRNCIESKLDEDITIDEKTASANEAARTYLASQSKPDLDVGRAAEAGYWNFDHEAFDHVRNFLVRLERE